MDIDLSQLPDQAAEALLVRHEQVRVVRDGRPVARLVPEARPVPRDLAAFRARVPALDVSVADLLREERDER